MPVESAVGTDSPSVNRWGWGGAYSALDDQRFVDGLLGRLERGCGDGAEVSLGTVNVEGLHRVRVGYLVRLGMMRPNAPFRLSGSIVTILSGSPLVKMKVMF